jgi:hypothetical protein
MPNRITEDEVSDTTDDDSSNADDTINRPILKKFPTTISNVISGIS